jgi:hypothetical protein
MMPDCTDLFAHSAVWPVAEWLPLLPPSDEQLGYSHFWDELMQHVIQSLGVPANLYKGQQ